MKINTAENKIAMNDWDIVETYHADGVVKYIHANGLETTLKTIPTCGGSTNKAVLFVSSSVGCRQGCKFCFLTAKKMKYCSVDTLMVINACKTVIDSAKDIIANKYLKISFMGMGEVLDSEINVFEVVKYIFDYTYLNNSMCLGIDGVDIGTSAPTVFNMIQIDRIKMIKYYLDTFIKDKLDLNPDNDYSFRTTVRIFFSLHSIYNRKMLMPKTRSLRDFNSLIRKFKNFNIIFHYMMLSGINDRVSDIVDISDYISWYNLADDVELRLLRFNKCPGLEFDESDRVQEAIDYFSKCNIKFKYQISAGSEIMAACGQFICKEKK
jgi:adenine C2-methylase RlmN of 23S rRNA A2503 and tRNA A37